ncbi:cadherin repeat domain-containing protein [uncultured Algibacter sp.]|uniref:cadherin repeat domain-containing protein n=1 Tax=uncultured Algibacter sp. TaxID=298659 RepID=UPI002630EF9D|nr:cadherin repeat domain-containing protein [uncultured Algibacter sp.]
MKTIKLFTILLFTFILACSKSDDSSNNKGINAQNLVTTIDENPVNGDVIGTLQAVGDGTLSFAIASQTVAGALNINPSTGVISVADASLFDFETNPIISANISIIDASNSATATATFNLNDIDDIESFLSTSKSAYSSANDGDWVIITEVEYNNLANSLNDINKSAMTDLDYSATPSSGTLSEATIANNDGVTIPNGSYIFAVKYKMLSESSGATIKIKQSSTNISDEYLDLGNTLNSTTIGDNFLVLKGSNMPTTSTGYLAIYESGGQLGFLNVIGKNIWVFNGDANNLAINQGDSTVFYQGLSTTQKQW